MAFSVCQRESISFYQFSSIFERRSSSSKIWGFLFGLVLVFFLFYPLVKSKKAPKVKGACLPLALTPTKSLE